MAETPGRRRCGTIALVGAPNTGKSTLLNSLVGAKVSIVTPKVQTTRSRITAICVDGSSQLVFVDTPGIIAPRRRLEKAMVAAAWTGAHDADIVVVLVDAKRGVCGNSLSIIEGLARTSHQGRGGARDPGEKSGLGRTQGDAVLALNKIDLVRRPSLLELAAKLDRHGLFERTFMISALAGDGVDDLRAYLAARVPSGPWLYPEDQLADMPERLLGAEITREKLFLQLHQELPYAATVETESWEERADGSVRVGQVVYVERETQKAIVLGRGGSRIKAIGTAAREELEQVFGRPVHLFIFVKVRAKWADDPERYRQMGLEFPG